MKFSKNIICIDCLTVFEHKLMTFVFDKVRNVGPGNMKGILYRKWKED